MIGPDQGDRTLTARSCSSIAPQMRTGCGYQLRQIRSNKDISKHPGLALGALLIEQTCSIVILP
jgi:hypothetical protein